MEIRFGIDRIINIHFTKRILNMIMNPCRVTQLCICAGSLYGWVVRVTLRCSVIDGLMQERRNSIANGLELRLSCTNPSIWSTSYPSGLRGPPFKQQTVLKCQKLFRKFITYSRKTDYSRCNHGSPILNLDSTVVAYFVRSYYLN